MMGMALLHGANLELSTDPCKDGRGTIQSLCWTAGVDSIRSSIGSCGSTHHRFTACAHMLAEGGRMLSAATNYGQLLKTETSYRVDLKYQFIISVDSWTEEQTNIIPLV